MKCWCEYCKHNQYQYVEKWNEDFMTKMMSRVKYPVIRMNRNRLLQASWHCLASPDECPKRRYKPITIKKALEGKEFNKVWK